MNRKCNGLLALTLLAAAHSLQAQVTLPKIFGSGMVLQRDKPLKIWGWASAGHTVQVHFNHQAATTHANANGEWAVTLKPMPAGGPYELDVIAAHDSLVYKNILLGDVWICGGQSNMEFPISGWSKVVNAEQEIAQANHPDIRLFTVEKDMHYLPAKDIKGGQWLACNPDNIAPFSAIAYFFGRKLNQDLHVPIGLISSNWGGTQIQEWMSWDVAKTLPEYKDLNPYDSASMVASWAQARQQYDAAIHNDPGEQQQWYNPATDTTSWDNTPVPNDWSQTKWGAVPGIVWYRKTILLTSAQAQSAATLQLGVIDDNDVTYVNGQQVGAMNNWYTPRSYILPAHLLHEGINTLVVKVVNTGGGAGFESKANEVNLQLAGSSNLPLAGAWLAKPSVLSTQYNLHDTGPNAFPSQLYNAMLAPIIPLTIKGAIWYQGEQNANTLKDARAYAQLFPMMINDWRKQWKDTFPFCWAQLTSFQSSGNNIWPYLREAQHNASSLPQTGEAVITDLGASHDIHPKNKQDVGYRLALSALKVAYHKNGVYTGPTYTSLKITGPYAVLTFANTGSGLIAKGTGTLQEFVVAGADHQFVPAQAVIKGNTVIVSSAQVLHPVAVRYAWKDDVPDANLFNKEGLPASPFRTDKW
ncbi:sialate O-acetylesterase [Chitinophaga costaii]|uniref:Sialate O-acetylesterase n=1 Tax=Chitinophaga costaii TaxID=1335309 RepID=A0A1C4FKB4_9BACT|nr:sialate O-acetylesterase [Chitinophaga costaii]PUZ30000.1 9-O-acetylesterase [Chitinophaga costaii]SCC56312.1 sialate O-acetylesterase [Chitinophaga costaii]